MGKRLERMFRYRHAMTLNDLAYESRMGSVEPQTVLISGATGLVGRALAARLTTRGHAVKVLSRRPQPNGIVWDPAKGLLPDDALDDVDCVIHLAGESIAQRWTPAVRKRIMDSRVNSSRLLVDAILKSNRSISYIASSGINFYGNQQDAVLTEESPSGSGYLAEVCRAWEGAADPLIEAGQRCAFLRTGVVLSTRGGALAQMLPAFRAGVAGRIGSGDQKMSWIALDDLVDQFLTAIEDPGLSGPINAVTPTSLTNREFTKALGAALKRPTVLPVPAAPLRRLLGGMAEETILADLAVKPAKLQDQAFVWRFPELDQLLRHELGCVRA